MFRSTYMVLRLLGLYGGDAGGHACVSSRMVLQSVEAALRPRNELFDPLDLGIALGGEGGWEAYLQ